MTDEPITPQSKGGRARAEGLTPERRSEIAQRAAQARWGNGDRPPRPSRPYQSPGRWSDVDIGRNVRMMRNARKMTGEELAARCGIGYQRHRRLEEGDIPFDIALLVRISDILDTTPGRLLDGPVTHRMIDLAGIPDDQAAALELMADSLRVATGVDKQA